MRNLSGYFRLILCCTFIAAAFAPYLKRSYDWPQLMRLVTQVPGKRYFLRTTMRARLPLKRGISGKKTWMGSCIGSCLPPRGSLLDTLYKTLHPQSTPGL
jgi:hypothetical protein